jgi:hypothetical protein
VQRFRKSADKFFALAAHDIDNCLRLLPRAIEVREGKDCVLTRAVGKTTIPEASCRKKPIENDRFALSQHFLASGIL